MRPLKNEIYITLLCLITLIIVEEINCQDSSEFLYKIPNPFQRDDVKAVYSFQSLQSTVSEHKKKNQLIVEDYFTLSGLSFSFHKNRKNEKENYVLIADGPEGRSYIARNYDSVEKFECELDHLHHHKQIFPWQYVFDVSDKVLADGDVYIGPRRSDRRKNNSSSSSSSPGSDSMNKINTRWARKRYIYGIGAIWLNAIERDLVSTQIGDKSPYPDSNAWEMKENDVTIKLLFEKPQAGKPTTRADSDGPKMQLLLEKTNLKSIELIRQHSLSKDQHDNDSGASSTLLQTEYDNILITKFDINNSDGFQPSFGMILKKCRTNNIKQRLFPRLIKTLSLSPNRLFVLDYIEKKFPRLVQQNKELNKLDKYNEEEHRLVTAMEFKSEWFSFKKETQVSVYQPMFDLKASFFPNETNSLQVDGEGKVHGNNEQNNYDELKIDIFMKCFTQNEKERSSRHSTVHYHMIERSGLVEVCRVGEHEPMPKDHLFSRPIYFGRPSGVKISARLTGLGALIMNAADIHYEQFNLFRKKIKVSYDHFDPNAKVEVEVDGWEIFDRKTDRKINFYFHSKDNSWDQHEIEDLIRIDIHDTNFNPFDDNIVTDADDDTGDDDDMLIRFDIVNFVFEASEEEIETHFKPNKLCFEKPTQSEDKININDEDIDDNPDDEKDDFYHDDNFYNNLLDEDENENKNNDENKPNDEKDKIYQNEGEDFEFIPGQVMEVSQLFPDFYEHLNGEPAYTILSKVQLIIENSDGQTTTTTKHVHFMENVDLETEMARYMIYYSDEALALAKPDLEYYINYNSELIFEIYKPNEDSQQSNRACRLTNDVVPWLRLISAPLTYYKSPSANIGGSSSSSSSSAQQQHQTVIESNRIPLYGLGALWRYASESAYTEFVGLEKKAIIGDQNVKFKRIRWNLMEDPDLVLTFQFLLNLDEADKKKKGKFYNLGRTFNLLKLDSIFVSEMYNIGSNESSTETKFNRFKIDTPQVFTTPDAKEHIDNLPEMCRTILADALERFNLQLEEKYSFKSGKIPNFFDFIQETNQYTAQYTVTYHSSSKETKSKATSVVQPIMEYFNRNTNKGLLEIGKGKELKDFYINGGEKSFFLYSFETKTCKRITNLNSLIELGTTFGENSDFSLKKMYGLAAIWITLGEMNDFNLRVTKRHDSRGNLIEVRHYEVNSDILHDKNDYKIGITFVERPKSLADDRYWFPGLMKTRDELEFELERIEIRPIDQLAIGTVAPRITIDIQSMHPLITIDEHDFEPRDECKNLSPSGSDTNSNNNNPNLTPSDGVSSSEKFPKVLHLIRGTNQFYIRSEITSSVPMVGSDKRIYLMDEWLYHKDIRMKTYGLKKNLDLLIYADTKELFDLSEPFKCPQTMPKLEQSKPRTPGGLTKLVDFWNDQDTIVDNLFQLYYGPISLWYLAEKNLNNVKLANSMDIAPKPFGQDNKRSIDNKSHLEREMRSETWRVSSPPGSKQPWQYDMHFEKVSNEQLEWHILQRIDLIDTEYLGIKRHVEIDIVNYLYNQEGNELMSKFLLPEGYNCLRSQLVKDPTMRYNDELDLNLDRELYSLWYEASLELMDFKSTLNTDNDDSSSNSNSNSNSKDAVEQEDDLDEFSDKSKNLMLPTILGSFIATGGSVAPQLDLWSDYNRVRFLDGSLEATKTVFDGSSSMMWQTNQLTGFCEQAKVPNRLELTLEFPLPSLDNALNNNATKRFETITLDKQLIKYLFLRTNEQSFEPLNWYRLNDLYISTYEKSFDELKLSNTFEGPVSIVRKYQHQFNRLPQVRTNDMGESTKFHKSLYTKVLLFNKERTKVIAILRIGLSKINSDINNLKELFKETTNTIEQCYNDGNLNWDKQIRSFKLEYLIETNSTTSLWLAQFDTDRLEREFISNVLLKQAELLPLQLDGNLRFEFAQSGRIKVFFNLLDGPSAIEYFVGKNGFTMNENMLFKSEIRITKNLNECSKLCDKLYCVALSYCADHTCKLLTSSALAALTKPKQSGSRSSLPKNVDNNSNLIRRKKGSVLPEEIEFLERIDENLDCSYFYKKTSLSVQDLELFSKKMDQIVNQARQPAELAKFAIRIEKDLIVPESFEEFSENFQFENEDNFKETPTPTTTSGDGDVVSNDREQHYRIISTSEILTIWDITNLKQVKEGKMRTIMEQANSYMDCSEQCKDNNCMIFSYCKTSSSCTLVMGSSEDLKEVVEFKQKSIDKSCTITVRDYTKDFTKFDNTMEPQKYLIKLDNYGPLECAAACKARELQVLTSDNSGLITTDLNNFYDSSRQTCLSFDSCSISGEQDEAFVSSICYLQNVHLMMDEFDRAILAPKWHELEAKNSSSSNKSKEVGNNKRVCDHYSKSILADYVGLTSKKFKNKHDSMLKVLRGQNDEKCALDCKLDEKCLAFEYCFNDKLEPTQACYFMGKYLSLSTSGNKNSSAEVREEEESSNTITYLDKEFLNSHLTYSPKCNIYILNHLEEQFLIDESSKGIYLIDYAAKLIEKNTNLFLFLLSLIGFIILALFVGSIVQLAYIKLFGEPVLFSQY